VRYKVFGRARAGNRRVRQMGARVETAPSMRPLEARHCRGRSSKSRRRGGRHGQRREPALLPIVAPLRGFVSGTAQTTAAAVRTDRLASSDVVGVAEEHVGGHEAEERVTEGDLCPSKQESLICSLENRHCPAPVKPSDWSGSSCVPSKRVPATVVSGFATHTEFAPEWIGSKPLSPEKDDAGPAKP
jgi:hypothetical protein